MGVIIMDKLKEVMVEKGYRKEFIDFINMKALNMIKELQIENDIK